MSGKGNIEPENDPWENPRIYSKNIPSKKLWKHTFTRPKKSIDSKKSQSLNSSGKIKETPPYYEDDELKNFRQMILKKMMFSDGIVTAGMTGMAELGDYLEKEKNVNKSFVVFYGFSGMLAQSYSVVDKMTKEEIATRMAFAGDKVPWKVETLAEFQKAIDMFAGTPNALKLIDFNDALNQIRTGIDITEGGPEFIDSEEDEFDDNCVEDCKPGNHVCGK